MSRDLKNNKNIATTFTYLIGYQKVYKLCLDAHTHTQTP